MPNLVGIGLSQVPTNSMLGGLAYQDPEHASIKNLDLKNLSQINSEIADTAVDVFVYDTSKDSDGGAWRKRTTDASWYNETLGTATRGTRREFPAVAVIVAEDNGLITIYDGDDPDLSMWMKWTSTTMIRGGTSRKLAVKNGIIALSTVGTYNGLIAIYFISDTARSYRALASSNNTEGFWKGNIAGRNDYSSNNYSNGSGGNDLPAIVSENTNDVAMTVLPNAPIDPSTGLPVPTIAVGTAGGASVIRDDGTVADITGFSPVDTIHIDGNNIIASTSSSGGNDFIFKTRIPASDEAFTTGIIAGTKNYYMNSNAGTTPLLRDIDCTHTEYDSKNQISYRGGNGGIDIIAPGEAVSSSSSKVNIAYITTSYNTGYMHGDIKGAFLSDTDVEDGVELVSNGTFNTDTTGWTMNGGGSATVSSGQVQITNNGTTNDSLNQTVTTVVGKTYEISATITPQGGGPMPRLYVGNKYVQVPSNANSAQTVTLTFLAYSTSTIVSINANTNVSNAVTLADNVSMKLTNDVTGTNLIANGDFSTNSTAAFTTVSGGTATVTGGLLKLTDTSGSFCYASAPFATVIGNQYYVTVDIVNNSNTAPSNYIRCGNSHNGTEFHNTNYGTSYGTKTFYFTATATTTYLTLITGHGAGNPFGHWDNISITLVEEDRSVNNNGLQVFGTITKTAVATGAELLAYSGFNASNHLENTSFSVNFGNPPTISIMCWQKITDISDYSYFITFNAGSANRGGISNGSSSSGYPGQAYFNMGDDTIYSGFRVDDGEWHCIVGTINGTAKKLYVDGKQVSSTTISNHDMTGVDKIRVGTYGDSYAYPHLGSLALCRVSASVPSPAQVKKMYEDEKHLFVDNAKATLYGSSDAVTALAYDDTTELLHVGTSAGRSEFQGLRRINNTTTAVTTAISASNDLVAEQ